MAGRAASAVLAVAAVSSGCAFLGAGVPMATDAPVPASLRAAVEPARQALLDGWPGPASVRFRFVEGRCGIGAMAVLVFQQRVPGEPPSMALALSDDVAKGILLGSWVQRYDVPDPDADAALQRLIGGREIACP